MFSLQVIHRFPLPSCLCFSRPPTPFFPEPKSLSSINFHSCVTSSVFRKLSQPVNSRLGGHSSSLLLWTQFKFSMLFVLFSLDQVFSLLVCLSSFNHSGFGRHLKRFVCVLINSTLSPHSNISIVLVHHLSIQHPFPMVFYFSGP